MAEISIESLGLKKPLEKMTAKELRELAIEKIPQIVGASAMSKEELLQKIKELCGLTEGEKKESPYKAQIRAIKKEIKKLKELKLQTHDKKEREKIRKKIKKLKRLTRKLAAA